MAVMPSSTNPILDMVNQMVSQFPLPKLCRFDHHSLLLSCRNQD